MPSYRLTRDLVLKKGAVVHTPAPIAMAPIQYGHLVLTPGDPDNTQHDRLTFVSIPFDEALREGLIEEAE